jgi:uncharacterized membrane protein YphA (DoxX/SURF4 family)
MKRIVFKKNWFVILTSLLLAALFIYAAYNKLNIYHRFVTQLHNSPITKGYENILAWLVPASEIITAGLLLFRRTRLAGLYSSFFIMLAFTVYVYVLPHFFTPFSCSCGGIISRFSWKQHFWFNVGFFTLAGLGLCLYTPRRKTQSLI